MRAVTKLTMRAILLLCVIAAVTADTPETLRKAILPHARLCKETLRSTDEEVDDVVNLRLEKVTDAKKCLGECMMESMGLWKDGKFLPSSFGLRVKLYKMLHEGDAATLAEAERIVQRCSDESEKKAAGKKCIIYQYAAECALSKIE